MASGKTYRKDIDGLRGVAVLGVVIYHFNKDWLPGGYIGVDIFFVISGYLITKIIAGEMASGTFSFQDFYLRRVRRIVPVLLVVVALTLLAGAMLMLPADIERLARSAAWSVVASANVYFWTSLENDYFAASSEEEPLLHLWSLGVEEHFYLLWPALLVGLFMMRGRRAAWLVALGLAAGSFTLAEIVNETHQKFAFYMLPARAGELMVGALLAFRDTWSRAVAGGRGLGELAAVLGIAAIGYSIVWIDDTTPFPGLAALPPVLGAALLIFAGSNSSRLSVMLLGFRPLVLVGLISYSLYLWHWPILAFIRYFAGTVEFWPGLSAATAMLLLSVATYRWVEGPARHWRPSGSMQLAWLFAVPGAVISIAATMLVLTQGMKQRIEESPEYLARVQELQEAALPATRFDYNCQQFSHDPAVFTQPRCLVGGEDPARDPSKAGDAKVLLVGDSNAAHVVGVLGAIAREAGSKFRNISHSACPPLFEGDYSSPPYKAGCDRFRPYLKQVLAEGRYPVVVLSASWQSYAKAETFQHDVAATLDMLGEAGVKVYLIGQVPIFPGFNRSCEQRSLRVDFVDCGARLRRPDTGENEVNQMLAGLASDRDWVTYLTLHDQLCDGVACRPVVGRRAVYFDPGHLSMDGSWLLGEQLVESEEGPEWLGIFSER